MQTESVLYIERDGLGTLTLNRPEKLNSLDTEVFRQLLVHIEHIGASTDSIGCLMLRGNGRAFSAGHDLGAIGAVEGLWEHAFQSGVIEKLANLPQPV